MNVSLSKTVIAADWTFRISRIEPDETITRASMSAGISGLDKDKDMGKFYNMH